MFVFVYRRNKLLKNKLPLALVAAIGLSSCHHLPEKMVDTQFVDSLILHYSEPAIAKQNQLEMEFWKNRINPKMTGFVNEGRYAGSLAARFRLFGNIDDLKDADSVLEKIDRDFNGREAAPNLAMISHCITEHRFQQADSFLQKSKRIGIKHYESLTSSFDVDFELGRFTEAKIDLNGLKPIDDYGYFFRKSKMDHLENSLDSAIESMTMAAKLASSNTYLRAAAMSNAADLSIHAGELEQANDLYMKCIRMNSADFHSLMGLAWIATVYDHDNALAKKICLFVQSKFQLPDPLYKLSQISEAASDSISQLEFAHLFEKRASLPAYGRMYNKYLIQLYTGILHQPGTAEKIASDELNNRATPQTYAWYAWSLAANNKPDQAYQVFEKYVSGKPLEGLELYWMGRMMEILDRKYNALEFYKAALKNKYDLDPGIARYIQLKLS